MNRFIVVNPESLAIQGDIMCASAVAAVARLEAALTADTENAAWEVYVAPSAFPAPGSDYSGLDPQVVSILSGARAVLTAPNGRRAPASLALAS